MLFGSFARAQQIQFAQQRGPYYVGEPMVVQVTADGFESGKDPVCKLRGNVPGGVTIEGPHVSRSVNSFIQTFNGRVTRRETVNYRFNFVVTAKREGEYRVGPFALEFDGKSEVIDGTTVKFEKLENDPDMQIEITLPQKSLYVGQQVPLNIRWAYAGDLNSVQYAFSNLQIRSPMFDQFSFKDVRPTSRTVLTLNTAKGEVHLDAEVTKENEGDKEFIVVQGKRTMVADSAGNYDAIPVTCRTKKVTQWGRDFFGDLVARSTKPSLSAGKPVKFVVKPIPTAGRPESFAGAVGSGFSIEVAANRTVVRVGDPISLDVTLRGDGNLENTRLPSLSADGGMSEELFNLPNEQPAGSLAENAKQFKLSVRVKDESVNQLPALAFSWFDPIKEQFSTARSKPIALQVMPAQVISAADVVSSNKVNPSSNSEERAVAVNTPRELSFVGANLAIEKDASRLLVDSGGAFSGGFFIGLLYVAGVGLVVAAVVVHRKSQIDPAIAQRRNQMRKWQQQIVSAKGLSSAEAANQVAEALRNLVSSCETADRSQADKLISECENRIYDRSGGAEFDETIADRALELANQLMAK